MRQSVERMFNSLKMSRPLTSHRYREPRKLRLHAALSMLAYLAAMLAHLVVGDYSGMRQMRIPRPVIRASDSPIAVAV